MDDRFGNYPLWIAEYGVDAPHVPAGWQRWNLWQWRGDADLPEVAPIVDLDRLHPEVDLEELLIPEPGRGGAVEPDRRAAPASGGPGSPAGRYSACSSSVAARSSCAAYSRSTPAVTAIWVSPFFHSRCSMVSRAAGRVLTPYPV